MREPICLPAEVRPVPGFPGLHVGAGGDVYGPRGRRRPSIGTDGYAYVTVRRPGKVTPGKVRVHVAVLLAWVGPKPEGMEGRHVNGVLTDNRAANLTWSTHLENVGDQELHGTRRRGSASHLAKLTESDVRAMRAAWPAESYSALGRRYGVGKDAARLAVMGRRWAHLSREDA